MTVLPRQFHSDVLVPCDVCGRYLQHDTSHVVHEKGCRFTDGMCRCDTGRIVCANCCPTCNGGAA